MIKKWDDLLSLLNIKDKKISPESIEKISQWCKENVSSEAEFIGDNEEKYNALKKYLSHFFETIASHQADGLTYKHRALKNMSLVQYAALQGYDQYLEQALKKAEKPQVVVNDATQAGMTALHFSAFNGHLKTSEILLAYGADGTKKSKLQQTPLHLSVTVPSRASATVKANKELIFPLLKQKFPTTTELTDLSGDSIAHLMAQNGFTDLINILKEQHPKLLITKDGFQCTTLHSAILNKQLDTVKALVTISPLLTIGDKDGKKPLHYAAMYANQQFLESCAVDGSDIDVRDSYLRTALHLSALAGNLESVKFLISKGADITKTDSKGFDVLHYATTALNINLVRWLIENTEVDINRVDSEGRTALMNLFINNKVITSDIEHLIFYFVEQGADLSVVDHSGKTVGDYVADMSEKGISISEELYSKTVTDSSLTL